ncbi:tRNA (guanosine(46)-N7)-methyltransferase TrmB [Melghirimyces algeriensis]|uniref:tRNA (guanine-N(7)-)-methyltransferase n=1 Tax=Melghirimyces algeriensis TaxID=910412 RepID=A0A521CM66_9BACL|nr:tRNA (guanosine(46)-N7)-methyltransferase TrmB [Melghirimyces algeriensis]SMO60455.1 tRNA (guanine-N7-)-methyltransferase [Melghirimyces algeriensis]
MRIRRKPYAKKAVCEHPRVVMEPVSYKGRWKKLFQNENPIYLELGTGKGQFISNACISDPHVNWIGVERIEEVLLQALAKADKTECTNLRFLWMDVNHLDEVFDEGEVDKIHLHFSDPWPKKRHAKRRLTHHSFLERYKNVLKADGHILLKTDNELLFDFSVEELEQSGFRILEYTRDLYNSPYIQGNIATEYEEKFVAKGFPIYYLLAQPVKGAH